MTSAGLTNHRGRILFTDNFYTSMALATHMWNKYGWTICGTITLTDKKSRQDYDVPFVKMSKVALNMVPRGWFREAVWRYLLYPGTTKKFWVQVTTWRDKKQVSFLHTHKVGNSRDHTVRRHVKGRRGLGRIELAAPRAQEEYADNFNAVDRND